MTFQLIIGLMFLLALALALYPLIKPAKQTSSLSHRQAQLDIYAQRVKELEIELDAGDLKQADFDLAVADLEREIVESGGLADEEGKSKAQAKPTKSWFALIAGLLTPVLALFLYFNFAGTPRAADPDFQQRNQAMAAANSSDVISTDQILQMIESLENYLQEVPEDTEKWVLLARTYAHAQKYPEAAQAYAQAFDNGLTYDPNMLASYADTLAYVQSSFVGRPTELLNLALELDANHGLSLWLAGTAAYAREDWPQAETYWRTLLSLLPPDAKEVEILQQSLEEVAIRKSGHK